MTEKMTSKEQQLRDIREDFNQEYISLQIVGRELTPDEKGLFDEKAKPLEAKWLADVEAAGIKDGPQVLDEFKRLRAEIIK